MAEQLCAIMGGTFTVVHSRQLVTFEILLPFIAAPAPAEAASVGLRVLYADVTILFWLCLIVVLICATG